MNAQKASLTLAHDGKSSYQILVPQNATRLEIKSAEVLQNFFTKVSSVKPDIVSTYSPHQPVISIGNTSLATKVNQQEGFNIRIQKPDIIISGGPGKGILYGVYTFIEKYLGCRKWAPGEPAVCPPASVIQVPSRLNITEAPSFMYREVYSPAEADEEYMDWHKLHSLEHLWGIWGHSFNKLVDPKIYFKSHPEYFSYFNGKRIPAQLCLSNKDVLDITVASLEKAFAENPDAIYWSVSPNDETGYCECDNCKRADAVDGGPQGSLIQFVNKIAERFPEIFFTTLAYTYSAKAPLKTIPQKNVYVFLSSIDAYRLHPLEKERSASAFRNNLTQWLGKTKNIFIWDYTTQFTNYLTPFPNTETLISNTIFFRAKGIKGVFAQGSDRTYSDMMELKSYILAKSLWNTNLNTERLINDFLEGYYGKAAPLIKTYLANLHQAASVSNAKLNIYGNPVNDYNSYLTPEYMDVYSQVMDQCERVADGSPVLLKKIERLRLSQEYVFLQQSRFYGQDKYGIFYLDDTGKWKIKQGFERRVAHFIAACKVNNVRTLSETGISPDEYFKQWQVIFRKGVRHNKALGAKLSLKYPFIQEYPAKKERTLTDGTRGYDDFSYNWLCFYGTPMECIVDLGAIKDIDSLELNFLEDQRHWIFPPESVTVFVSTDGIHYKTIGNVKTGELYEHYEVNRIPYSIRYKTSARYIKVIALNREALPEWRFHKTKKPMIACDEIWVE